MSLADKIDVFEAKYRERYPKHSKSGQPFRYQDPQGYWIEGPEGFIEESFEGYTREHLDQLNEAFRLGYRAALMERA